jgi:hypothetical protein
MGARTRNFWLVVWENIVLGYSRVNQIEGLILEWRGVERLKMEGRVFLEELEKSVVEDTIRSDSAPFLYMWERQPRAGRGDQKGCRSSAESSVRSVSIHEGFPRPNGWTKRQTRCIPYFTCLDRYY